MNNNRCKYQTGSCSREKAPTVALKLDPGCARAERNDDLGLTDPAQVSTPSDSASKNPTPRPAWRRGSSSRPSPEDPGGARGGRRAAFWVRHQALRFVGPRRCARWDAVGVGHQALSGPPAVRATADVPTAPGGGDVAAHRIQQNGGPQGCAIERRSS